MNQLFELLQQHGLTPNQFYVLYYFRQKTTPPLKNLKPEVIACQFKGFLDDKNNLTTKALLLLTDAEAFFKKTRARLSSQVLGDDYLDKIRAYRELFPPGVSRAGYSYRASPEELKDKFIWFFNRYPDCNWDLVLEATRRYIEANREDGFRMLTSAAYFIQRSDTLDKSVKSRLADGCHAILEGAESAQVVSLYRTE